MPDPLLTGLVAGPVAAPAGVASSIARALAPEEDPVTPPAWLLSGQHRSFRRLIAAIRRYHGALLADPVGSGKTFVALAVAAAINSRRTTACLVPSALVSQWRAVAARLEVQVAIASHEQASRGRLPEGTRGLAIVDESHHFRNPSTRRYGFTAPWLVGRPVLLVSATPIVNRLDDLAHQLRLGVREDALAADGMISLRRALRDGCALSALARVVIEERGTRGPRPERVAAISRADGPECVAVTAGLSRIARLSLSRHPPTASLVRGVLQRAAGSSPAALLGALRRYRALLLHARDARASGQSLSRTDIRRFAGELEDQLVLWQLVRGGESGMELDLTDLDALNSVIAETVESITAPDPKLARLASILADNRPTLVFVTRRETVRHLRDRLGGRPLAWCTGERAGLGASLLPREAVLGWFRAGSSGVERHLPAPPLHLIATDVAAEGLDLQRAERVVHYDPPWTPMRLEQREGRAVRLGSEHRTVEVIRFLPPPALEAVLRIEQGLSRKANLPALAGLGPAAISHWRRRAEVAESLEGVPAIAGVGFVRGNQPGVLAGFTFQAQVGSGAECLGAVAGWMTPSGEWCEDEDVVSQMISAAAGATDVIAPHAADVRDALRALVGPIRAHLATAGGRRWTGAQPDAGACRVMGRLRDAARRAARQRDASTLQRLERAMEFVGGGHTAGEAVLVRRLAELSDRELPGWLARLPLPYPRPDVVEVRLSGLVLFGE